jgi:predicted nucleotidyltransferase
VTEVYSSPNDEQLAEAAHENLILRATVGSTIHGLHHEGLDDRDEMGVFIEPPNLALGHRHLAHMVQRTQPEGARSGPGDLDLVLYSLRKWVRLAVAGNPTIILLLFSSDVVASSPLGDKLRADSSIFLSQNVLPRYQGYMRSQRERLLGLRGQKRVKRPELVDEFGYDTKYAMHLIRLGYQGLELLESGRLTLPMAEPVRSQIMAVRRGEVPFEEAVRMAEEVESKLEEAAADSPLPKQPDMDAIDNWVVNAYVSHWSERGLLPQHGGQDE